MWTWDNGEGAIFYFDIGETVRFRVEAEEWHDQIPNAPDMPDGSAAGERKPPYSIIVSLLCWVILWTGLTLMISRVQCKSRALDLLLGGREMGLQRDYFK